MTNLIRAARIARYRAFLRFGGLVPGPLRELYRFFVPRTTQRIFAEIYQVGAWSSGSGIGSRPENTVTYREFLQTFLRDHAIQSVVDLGCGDWASSRLIDWSGIRYAGIDVVPDVIEENRRTFGDRAEFLCLDFESSDLPAADLALVKDVFQHWPNELIRRMIGRLGQYRYVLITNCCYEDPNLNVDISMGAFRPVDLRREPFGYEFEQVLRFHTDGVPVAGDNKEVLLMRGTR
jgi:SAM-dependent methyltransferase